MNTYAAKVLEALPLFVHDLFESYSSDKVAVFKGRQVFSQPKAMDGYKFLMLPNDSPSIVIEKKAFHPARRSLVPVNPDQIHAFALQQKVPPFFPIVIEKEFMREASKLICNRSDVFFENDVYPMDTSISSLIRQFVMEASGRQMGYEFVLQSLGMQITVYMLRSLRNRYQKPGEPGKYLENRSVQRVIDFFNENIQSDFTLEEVAAIANFSPYHFIRIFRDSTGKTPFQYLSEIKIARAMRLLSETDGSITEIAMNSGFKNRTHFTHTFKRITGVSPKEYRK